MLELHPCRFKSSLSVKTLSNIDCTKGDYLYYVLFFVSYDSFLCPNTEFSIWTDILHYSNAALAFFVLFSVVCHFTTQTEYLNLISFYFPNI